MLLGATTPAASEDRLARFAEIGRRLAEAQEATALVGDLYALADAEILENLNSGAPFSSPEFIQERLDALTGTWGGVRLRVVRLPPTGVASPLTIGVFGIPGPTPRGSVRVYGRRGRDDARLLSAQDHDGAPEVSIWSPAKAGATFAATWLGGPAGSTGRPLVVEVWRDDGRRGLDRLWSTEHAFPDGLWITGLGVRDGAISIRYTPRLPGWQPGCPGQTELLDLYRLDARRGTVVLAGRRVINGSHRELHAAMARFLAALAAPEAAVVAELVPDRALRRRLPRALAADAVCDLVTSDRPLSVAVAATEARGDRAVPWSLTWRREARGWRLVAASPVLE